MNIPCYHASLHQTPSHTIIHHHTPSHTIIHHHTPSHTIVHHHAPHYQYTAPYKNMMDCVRQTFRHNGIRGPFQGLGATLLRDTPANSIYLGSFEVHCGYCGVCICVCTLWFVYVCVVGCVYVWGFCMFSFVCMCICMYMYVNTVSFSYIHTHIHTHTHPHASPQHTQGHQAVLCRTRVSHQCNRPASPRGPGCCCVWGAAVLGHHLPSGCGEIHHADRQHHQVGTYIPNHGRNSQGGWWCFFGGFQIFGRWVGGCHFFWWVSCFFWLGSCIHHSPLYHTHNPQKLHAEGGIARFYRGFTPCIIRAMPANAAMLFTVEVVTNALNK